MDKWLEAYASWPPANQLIFSVAVLVVSFFAVFLFGLWTIQIGRYAVVAIQGWPDDPKTQEPKKTKGLDPLCKLDWKEEQRKLAEEQRKLAEEQAYQARLQKEMERANLPALAEKKKALPEYRGEKKNQENSEKPCTEEVAGGHTLIERSVAPPLLEEPSRGA